MRHNERGACGVGFVASTEPSRQILDRGLHALTCVEHRGGVLADQKTSDGAGIMTEIPFDVLGFPEDVAVATLFIRRPHTNLAEARDRFRQSLASHQLEVVDFRPVPVVLDVLGERARRVMPEIEHAVIARPSFCRTEDSFGARLYLAEKSANTQLHAQGDDIHVASLSTRTIVYKALTTGADLKAFYPDLQHPEYQTRFALFHRRFSTNTNTSWDRAQPFRMIAHNGEINTIACNRAWSRSREQALGLPRDELMTWEGLSDSGNLNEMVEALRWRSSIPNLSEILAIMVPPAEALSNDFYKFWSRAVEPWDGPAFVAFSDGDVVGARLDRNGFRPCRWARTAETFYLASEAGVFDLDESEILEKGALHGGTGVHYDLRDGEIHFLDPSRSRENHNAQFDARIEPIGSEPDVPAYDLLEDLGLFGTTQEELDEILVPMIVEGKEPIGSMGNTARPAFLSDEHRSFFDFFFQNFAQVTNPPLDHLREALVTDLRCYLGPRPNVFAPKTLIPLVPGIELESPVLTPDQLAYLRRVGERSDYKLAFESVEIQCTFPRIRGVHGLAEALEELAERVLNAIRGGCSVIILTDRYAKPARPPIPSLLALRAASRVLTYWGHRLKATLVVDSADVRTTHQLACLVGFGAAAVCPYMAFEVAARHPHPRLGLLDPALKTRHLRRAFESGLLKVMSKMGISTVQGYQNSMLYSVVGLGPKLVEKYFPGIPSPIGGLELSDLAARILRHTEARKAENARPTSKPDPKTGPKTSSKGALKIGHQLREHRKGLRGERHSMTAELSALLNEICEDESQRFERWPLYERYLERVAEHAIHPRHLLALKPATTPVPRSEVEPVRSIQARFGSGAMSFGAISAESQRDIIHAMKTVGGRSSSGEGGENPYYFVDGTTASVKQIASGRFGVTAEYLVAGDEIEIKVAQGAKPGEGGQLMGVKVDAAIAKARHASPGVDLISPPPLHDIYSIEDLKQLIFELKELNPDGRVSVKLVAGAHVGTIAAGVTKAGADVVQISGGDGGTGAATISSMKHAGLPWELGLSEVHQRLVEEDLRGQVVLRVDGGLQTGRDIITAALLGAEEFGFGKLLLIAEGCIMARVCQKNTCPRGIATHDPKFKKKYRGSTEKVVAMLDYLAEDVRRHLASLGSPRLSDIVGRGDLLQVDPAHRERVERSGLDLSALLQTAPHPSRALRRTHPVASLNRTILDATRASVSEARPTTYEASIRSTDRATLTGLAGVLARRAQARRARAEVPAELPDGTIRIRLTGSAGQGFAAFLTPGVDVVLEGEANDSVAKSMSGGQVVIRPSTAARAISTDHAIIGNGAMYGATGGRLLVAGCAGDRFCVRNSGAEAVVEGVGLHACEYMTNGFVVILGKTSFNVGAGMTGGTVILPRSQLDLINRQYVEATTFTPATMRRLIALLEAHAEATPSRTARALVDHPASIPTELVPVVPVAKPQHR